MIIDHIPDKIYIFFYDEIGHVAIQTGGFQSMKFDLIC